MTLTALIAALQALEAEHGGKVIDISAEVRALGGAHYVVDAEAKKVMLKHVEGENSRIVISSNDGVEA